MQFHQCYIRCYYLLRERFLLYSTSTPTHVPPDPLSHTSSIITKELNRNNLAPPTTVIITGRVPNETRSRLCLVFIHLAWMAWHWSWDEREKINRVQGDNIGIMYCRGLWWAPRTPKQWFDQIFIFQLHFVLSTFKEAEQQQQQDVEGSAGNLWI